MQCINDPFNNDFVQQLYSPVLQQQMMNWTQHDVVEYAMDHLSNSLYCFGELGISQDAVNLLRKFSQAAAKWIFIGHPGKQRKECQKKLHTELGSEFGYKLATKQLEPMCDMLAQAWLILEVWDSESKGQKCPMRRTYHTLGIDVRLNVAYGVVKARLRHSALYSIICSPSSPFFQELESRLKKVSHDSSKLVEAYHDHINDTLNRLIAEPA